MPENDPQNQPADDPKDPAEPDPKEPGKGDLGDDPEKLRAALEAARKDAAKYRTKAKELEPLAAKAKELEDAGKSETEKLTGKLTEAEQRAATAERRALVLEVAAEKGLTAKQAKRLTGNTREEIEADADELLEEFPTQATDPDPKVRQRPRERLRGGLDPEDDPVELDPAKIAAAIPRR